MIGKKTDLVQGEPGGSVRDVREDHSGEGGSPG